MDFFFWKILHLFALVFWLGSGIGASWILIQSQKNRNPSHLLIEKYFEQVMRVEHAAFLLLLLTGFGMAGSSGWRVLGEPWLKTKLWLVAAVAAIEILDAWLYHGVIRRRLRLETDVDSPSWQKIARVRRAGYALVLGPVTALVIGIFYLAVKKPL